MQLGVEVDVYAYIIVHMQPCMNDDLYQNISLTKKADRITLQHRLFKLIKNI